MRSRTFTCIYCGNRKPWEARSEEHFIPKNIYGKFTIHEVCKNCNLRMGTLVDTAFLQYVRFAEYLKTGITETEGTATLGDRRQIEGTVKIVEQRTKSRPYSIWEFTSSDGVKIQVSDIADVKFLILDIEDAVRVRPGIAKIAYAGIHYLLNYKDNKFNYRNFVNRPQLIGLRLYFNPDATSYVSRTGTPHSTTYIVGTGMKYELQYTIDQMTPKEKVKMLKSFSNPEIRRHFLLLRQDGRDIEVLIVLLSWGFWKVRIHNYSLPIGVREEQVESLLPELNPTKIPSEPEREQHEKIYTHVKNPAFGK